MDRVWFLTWTTYGTWLPGDGRGFVSKFVGEDGRVERRNEPGTLAASDHPGYVQAALSSMKGDPVWLTATHAPPLLEQFRETANFRGWSLAAVALMPNHVHVVVGVGGDPEPSGLLKDFKSYGSRRLNRLFGVPAGGTWWTQGGSARILSDAAAVQAVVAYVERQANPLLVWSIDQPA